MNLQSALPTSHLVRRFNARFGIAQRGTTIIEIMVGLLIGLIGMVIVFQVFAVADSRKRTTLSGSDAQVAGTLGVFALERELMQAGFGLGRLSDKYWGCTVRARDFASPPPVDVSFLLYPILIAQGAANAPDTISVLSGSSALFSDRVPFVGSTPNNKTMKSRAGFAVGDVLIAFNTTAGPPYPCEMMQISNLPVAPFNAIVTHGGGPPSRFRAPTGPHVFAATGEVLNLGSTPKYATWKVVGSKLVATDVLGSSTAEQEIVDGVVDFQAQYGIDGANGGTINSTIEAGEWTPTTPVTNAEWSRVLAVRFAILTRGEQYEKEIVTTDDKVGDGAPNAADAPGWAAASQAFALTAVDWKHYRYRVYESSVSLRNMVWGK